MKHSRWVASAGALVGTLCVEVLLAGRSRHVELGRVAGVFCEAEKAEGRSEPGIVEEPKLQRYLQVPSGLLLLSNLRTSQLS